MSDELIIDVDLKTGSDRFKVDNINKDLGNGNDISILLTQRYKRKVIEGEIIGFCYYDATRKNARNRFDSYFLISGTLDERNGTFWIKLVDSVNNEEMYSGTVKDGVWRGEDYDKDVRISHFGLTETSSPANRRPLSTRGMQPRPSEPGTRRALPSDIVNEVNKH